MAAVDLNCDMGESFGAYALGADEEMLRAVTSANVACGFHAGDPSVMERTVALAARAGAAVGAHPGYPDLAGFGRRAMALTPGEARACVVYQVGALWAFARARGVPVTHVKPHGALYNLAAKDDALAMAICEGVRSVLPEAILVGLAGSRLLDAARAAGLRAASEAFADRAYRADGSLVPRSEPGAVIADEALVARRAARMAREGAVECADGTIARVRADTICVHGDTPGAAALARRIRAEMEACGIRVAPLSEILP